jgi:hypothetical protein
MPKYLTPELSDAGGLAHPHWQPTWPARVRSGVLVRPRHLCILRLIGHAPRPTIAVGGHHWTLPQGPL